MTNKETLLPHQTAETSFLNEAQQAIYGSVKEMFGSGIEIFYQRSSSANDPLVRSERAFLKFLKDKFGDDIEISYQPISFIQIKDEDGIPRLKSTTPDFLIKRKSRKRIFVEITEATGNGEEDEKKKQKNIMSKGFKKTIETSSLIELRLPQNNGKKIEHIPNVRVLLPNGNMVLVKILMPPGTNGKDPNAVLESITTQEATRYVVLYRENLEKIQEEHPEFSFFNGKKNKKIDTIVH